MGNANMPTKVSLTLVLSVTIFWLFCLATVVAVVSAVIGAWFNG